MMTLLVNFFSSLNRKNYAVLAIVSFFVFLLTLFSLQTVFFMTITSFFFYKFLQKTLQNIFRKGLLSFLPNIIKQQLEQRSLFDILCDFWFTQAAVILKVIFKPFIIHVQPDRASQVLNQLSPQVKKMFLTKGSVHILPQKIQKALISQQCYEQKKNIKFLYLEQQNSKKQQRLCLSTDDSKNPQKKELSTRKNSFLIKKKFIQQGSDINSSSQLSLKQTQHATQPLVQAQNNVTWDKLQLHKSLKNHIRKGHLIESVKDITELIRRLMVLKNVSNKVKKVNKLQVTLLVLFFWILLILQIKLSTKTRKFLFKTLYAASGVLSIFGALGTTGMLCYKIFTQRSSMKQIKQQ